MAMTDAGPIIDRWFEAHAGELLPLLSDLVSARSENPPGNERAAAAVVARFFQRHRIPFESHEPADGRVSLIGRVGSAGRRLFVAGHLDTVPAGDGWTLAPFEPVVRNGRLYGRGSGDNKGPTAALLLVARCLSECFSLRGTAFFGALADEERGSCLGLEWLLREGKISADYAIIPDGGGNLREIDVAEKGMLLLEVVSHGVQAHGSRPECGVNAIWNLIEGLRRFRERGLPPAHHALLGNATFNLGQIEGGSAPNVVPARAAARIDIRWLPGQSAEALTDWVRDAFRSVEEENRNARFEVEVLNIMPPTEVSPESDLVRTIRSAMREVTGADAVPVGTGGITVAKQLNLRGILAVGWGPGDKDLFHAADESVSVEELILFGRILARIAVRLLGAERTTRP